MFGSKKDDPVGSLLDQLTKRHSKMLKDGEVFLAACYGFGAAEPHPPPLDLGGIRRRQPVSVSSPDERLQAEAAARLRLASAKSAMGITDEQYDELPPSATGYVLSHTDRRMLIFDGTAKEYLVQAPMKGLWLQPVDHGDGMYTLVFTSGTDRVVVAARRDTPELTADFIESFPDRRGQRRVVKATNRPDIIDF